VFVVVGEERDGAGGSAPGVLDRAVEAVGREPSGLPGRGRDPEVRVEERRAVCPAGKESTQCSRLEEESPGRVKLQNHFIAATCNVKR
jgi:hypothetical protein